MPLFDPAIFDPAIFDTNSTSSTSVPYSSQYKRKKKQKRVGLVDVVLEYLKREISG